MGGLNRRQPAKSSRKLLEGYIFVLGRDFQARRRRQVVYQEHDGEISKYKIKLKAISGQSLLLNWLGERS